MYLLTRSERLMVRRARATGLFDKTYYCGAYPHLHPVFLKMPLRHYAVEGERMGLRPNPDFSPSAYLRHNADVAASGMSPFLHYVSGGYKEKRVTKDLPEVEDLPDVKRKIPRFDATRKRARVAIAVHIYYPDLWPEFADVLRRVNVEHDLFITLTWRGEETEALADEMREAFPEARVVPMPNRGRDILPFLMLVNAGALDGYEAVCKLHTKKSPHRQDGDVWRRHLIDGILPEQGLPKKLARFLDDDRAAFWVADGQHYTGKQWWGSNLDRVRRLLRRIEMRADEDDLSFPAGSIYWVKPMVLGLLKALKLKEREFDVEFAQVDGTLAHALERAIGFLATGAGQKIVQSTELEADAPVAADPPRPGHVSAFYLPQFHPTPENDAWWGKGFTEWRSVVSAPSLFAGHLQPMRPADLGYYDLRATEVMGEQTALAREAGIDAFCVYHYWFDGRRVLERPLDKLLERPEIDFPFYLCWANESWRRNWDGQSGEILLDQTYADGFEAALVRDTLPYMRDARYQRPDGTRPRFVIYRPEDMPDAAGSIARMREAWREAGIGEVELGAVAYHIPGESDVADDLFDFWIEMPPHRLVKGEDCLFGGPDGNRLGLDVAPDYEGLIYDYVKVAAKAARSGHARTLPDNTIAGIMPAWDNTARRGLSAHVAYGANPGSFDIWLRALREHRLAGSYRQELFINAWNEWAEKAVLEPSETFGRMYLDVLAGHLRSDLQSVGESAKDLSEA